MKTIHNIPTNSASKNWLQIAVILVTFVFLSGSTFAQFTLNGSTLNSGDYTCGTSTISQSSGFVNNNVYTLTVCAAPGELVVIELGTIVLANNGGNNNDDEFYITDTGTLNYTDGPGSNGTSNQTVTGTVPGGCVTITLECESTGTAQINATISCIAGPDAGSDQSPGDCSTSTTLAGNDLSAGTGGVWTVSPAGPSITTPTSPTSGVTGMTAGTSYTFTWSGNGSSSDMVFNSAGPGCATYCDDTDPSYTEYTNSALGNFSNVNINSGALVAASGWAGYTNNTSCVSVTQGESFTIEIDFDYLAGVNTAVAWIDWNANGVFEASEQYDLGSADATQTYIINDVISCNGEAGLIRIRIAVENGTDGLVDPCIIDGPFGEVEDYCFNVTAAPTPLAVTASNLPLCSSSATLDATGSSATGFWSIVSGSGTIADINDPTTTIDGLANGTTVVQWTATEACGTDVSQETIVVSGFPNDAVYAGADQSQCSITSTVLEGSSPSPYTGSWTVLPAGPTFDDATDPSATISGLVTGNTYTLTWSVTTSSCGVVADDMLIIVGSTPPPADAGSALAGCPESINMAAVLPAGFAGIWTQTAGPATATISDINDPNALMYGMTATGTYTYTWTISGGGCTGSTFADVDVVISNCQTTAPIGQGPYTGCNFLFTDDGGTAGNYSDGMSQAATTTVFCADDPADFVSMEFTAFDLAPGDYMLIHDSPSPGSPIVGYGTSAGIYVDPNGAPSSTQTIVSYTGCLYITFFSNSTVNDPGWEANVTCTSTGSAENSTFITGDNCGGGGGITVCESGNYPTVNSNAGSPQEIGNGFGPGTTCIADGEGNSQWVYFNIETSGFIEFEINPAGGQDFDFQIWGPYNGGISCPGFTGEEPIRCTWAINANNACPGNLGQSEIGLAYESPVASPSTVLSTDVNENLGSCVDGPGAEDGWLYPIDAVAGEVYVMLVQNYAQNAANWTFTYDGTTPGIAGLGCSPPTPLPLSLLTFNGENVDRKNNLYWTTASQRNSNYFTIEKSKDGINWEVLSIIAAAGYSDEFLMYEEVDNSPFKDLTYYRLLQTDLEGKSEIAKTIAIRSELAEENFTDIYPNPSDKNFYFNYGGNDFYTTINVEIINSLGQIVLMQDYSEFNKSTALSIDAGELSEGFYQVKITQGSRFEIQKISVIK
mgnify:FL=1